MSPFALISAVIAVVPLCGSLNHRFIRLPDTIGITAVVRLISLAMAGARARWTIRLLATIGVLTLVAIAGGA